MKNKFKKTFEDKSLRNKQYTNNNQYDINQYKNIKISKFISKSGICSRRKAEELLSLQKIKINGKLIINPATRINDSDSVFIEGYGLVDPKTNNKTRLWLFHKPRNIIVSSYDPQNRKIIFDLLPKDMPRVITIGRLDYQTEGLILITNSGYIARFFELPVNKVPRFYTCEYYGNINSDMISSARKNLNIDGFCYDSVIFNPINNQKVDILIKEGKNREIRKIMEYFGLKIKRLIRRQYGIFSIKSVPNPCDLQEVTFEKIKYAIQQINCEY
ncbi:pseudouridine synthase [Lyticum sinuosum]|uniref:Dual-specificity RNA pseudouridine synthase RluF n=1 Tax=Lyticum sinuosum TaxID=1332059 RepID=A0AAE4VK19_9RICK|nr:pseudouridine synthase [Lyticum sinuosum]MDZ5760955.1 rRNA pseudouridine synthase [Lyticum sinuosum]